MPNKIRIVYRPKRQLTYNERAQRNAQPSGKGTLWVPIETVKPDGTIIRVGTRRDPNAPPVGSMADSANSHMPPNFY